MFDRITKTFRNNATNPLLVDVLAFASFGTITELYYTGGTVPHDDALRAEAHRMATWINSQFKGKPAFLLREHSGLVPAPVPGITIVNTINSSEAIRCAEGSLLKQVQAEILRSKIRPIYSRRCPVNFVNVSGQNFHAAPHVGTYWRSKRNSTAYIVKSKREEDAFTTTVVLARVDGKGEFEFPFSSRTSKKYWAKHFEQVFGFNGEYFSDHYAMAAAFMRAPPPPSVGSADAIPVDQRDRRYFVVPTDPGKELPPAVGERYQSLIMGRNVYRVLDASRKLHSEDYYITMIREHDGHKAKFTYRDHVTWLTVWLPVLDEEAPAATAKAVCEAMHEEVQTTWAHDEHNSDAARQLRVIMAELDKRLPNWNDAPPGPVLYDDCALILRAIRTLARTSKEAEAKIEEAQEQVKAQLANTNRLNKKLAQTRIVPAIGSVWKNNSTGSLQTVIALRSEGALACMKTARNTVYDTAVEMLFKNYSLVTGRELSMTPMGEMRCNAYGMFQRQTYLKNFIEGSVFVIRSYELRSDGTVTVEGYTEQAPKKEG